MKDIQYDGYIKGLYSYFADNNENIKTVFSYFFKISNESIKIAFRREDLELMVLVRLKDVSDAVIMFTVNRLDEYKFNYDNVSLLHNIIDNFKVGSRSKKIIKIKERMSK
jgi:hypothetical protein